jgi:hypothetical protein
MFYNFKNVYALNYTGLRTSAVVPGGRRLAFMN